jgi:hypothetical protein
MDPWECKSEENVCGSDFSSVFFFLGGGGGGGLK